MLTKTSFLKKSEGGSKIDLKKPSKMLREFWIWVILQKLGVKISLLVFFQRTPLHNASANGALNVVKILVFNAAETNAKDAEQVKQNYRNHQI